MEHKGNIIHLYGFELPEVDCIIGGSPCQDLSVAGKRAGLAGERSGLFMEQIRIVKEMRLFTGKPRFMVWENVPGALSSKKGEDFRVVLEEIVKVVDQNAVIPRPPGGKWTTSGTIMGDGWSVAWRVLDAQFWGVPQRRRRIALVADFGGQSAPEILFERKSLRGDPAEGKAPRERTSPGTKDCSGNASAIHQNASGEVRVYDVMPTLSTNGNASGRNAPVICIQGNCIDRADTAGCNGKEWRYDTCYTLNTIDLPAVAYSFDSIASNSMKSKNPYSGCRKVSVSKTLDTTTPDPSKNQGGIAIMQRAVYDARGSGNGKTVPTLTGDHENRVTDYTAITFRMRGFGDYCADDIASCCKARDANGSTDIVVDADIVRRLTPLECERLQGYPDGWTEIGDWIDSKGKKRVASDSARYKALGNSIALPPWRYVLTRLCNQIGRRATMGSLFDGIGGFPLIWEEINGEGSCLWASEIEDFPIAVTEMRFGGETNRA